jgi:hypothetical protein
MTIRKPRKTMKVVKTFLLLSSVSATMANTLPDREMNFELGSNDLSELQIRFEDHTRKAMFKSDEHFLLLPPGELVEQAVVDQKGRSEPKCSHHSTRRATKIFERVVALASWAKLVALSAEEYSTLLTHGVTEILRTLDLKARWNALIWWLHKTATDLMQAPRTPSTYLVSALAAAFSSVAAAACFIFTTDSRTQHSIDSEEEDHSQSAASILGPGAGTSRPTARRMWRTCVHCDELFNRCCTDGDESGLQETEHLHRLFHEASVARGVCDSCIDSFPIFDGELGNTKPGIGITPVLKA